MEDNKTKSNNALTVSLKDTSEQLSDWILLSPDVYKAFDPKSLTLQTDTISEFT